MATKAKSPAAQGLRDLFVEELKDVYGAEKALTKAIPRMISNVTSPELAKALKDHLEITNQQISRLNEVFASIGEKQESKKCKAMDGLIEEAEEIMKSAEKGVVRDAAIILAAQKVEHYEIATYGTLRAFASTLGEEKAASLLEETLSQEKDADEKLTAIAEASINIEASEV